MNEPAAIFVAVGVDTTCPDCFTSTETPEEPEPVVMVPHTYCAMILSLVFRALTKTQVGIFTGTCTTAPFLRSFPRPTHVDLTDKMTAASQIHD